MIPSEPSFRLSLLTAVIFITVAGSVAHRLRGWQLHLLWVLGVTATAVAVMLEIRASDTGHPYDAIVLSGAASIGIAFALVTPRRVARWTSNELRLKAWRDTLWIWVGLHLVAFTYKLNEMGLVYHPDFWMGEPRMVPSILETIAGVVIGGCLLALYFLGLPLLAAAGRVAGSRHVAARSDSGVAEA